MILFEADDFVVVNKPAPLLVHTHPRFPKEYPLLQQVRDILGHYVWPIHRLDRQTSGCLIMAKRQEAVAPLSLALTQGSKQYWALVRGVLHKEAPIDITNPIKKNKSTYQEAHSTVWCLGHSLDPRCSIVRVQPHTGRHHQIRRHLRDIHHPILHDGDHGDSRVNRWWREQYGLSRLALHAGQIKLSYQNQDHCFTCPIADDLLEIFKRLPWWSSVQQLDSVFDG